MKRTPSYYGMTNENAARFYAEEDHGERADYIAEQVGEEFESQGTITGTDWLEWLVIHGDMDSINQELFEAFDVALPRGKPEYTTEDKVFAFDAVMAYLKKKVNAAIDDAANRGVFDDKDNY
jgi:hypothetical protein